MQIELVWVTPDAEKIIGYCARVSNPQNQDNPDVSKLLAYCLRNKHFSIFEMANMCIGIETSRNISMQILRHKSFAFQQFSTRYTEVETYEISDARRQDLRNRQNSLDDFGPEIKLWWQEAQEQHWNNSMELYKKALDAGIAKEVARDILPGQAQTKLYMNGNIRSWIHYLDLRSSNGTQLEHMQIAQKIKEIFIQELPIIAEALEWT